MPKSLKKEVRMKNLTLIAVMAIFLPFLGGCVVVTVRGTHPHTHNNYRTTRTYCDVCCGYGCGYANHQSYYRLVEVPRYRTSHGHHSYSAPQRRTQRTTQSYQQSSTRRQQASRSRIQRQTAQSRRTADRQVTTERTKKRRATTKKRRR